jgi:hypothetical protein
MADYTLHDGIEQGLEVCYLSDVPDFNLSAWEMKR